ncbi:MULTISPECIES: D-serine ammonia-lyase [Providencia]|uniref:D-serine ammonia-lyase n=1 Tax=Providencia TaxID=586 RepID=UPI00229DA2FB|nr:MULTISPECIES: D-serine ammonia-lyase [Providencia]HCT9038971.1 D-serine ammonia-lyase [Providencia rettgeri]HEP0307027.1 D-serine ammonia-lyase [Providencia rettgeri]
MTQINVDKLIADYPLVQDLIDLKQIAWFNPNVTTTQAGLPYVGLTIEDVQDAEARLNRFAPYLTKAFPETQATQGIIESEVIDIPNMQAALEKRYQTPIAGKMLLKKDSHLPISGSIKARGGIYEVLTHAEKLALAAGILSTDDNYEILFSEQFRQFFSQYRIAVGSTGNLGMSIGIMSAKLGFSVSVHMSADARQWKKDKLRSHGVNVVEYEQDYSIAVEQGRKEAEKDPNCFFIDDENSTTLFLGYAVAGLRLKRQFLEQGITVDNDHPLFVYLPCGVGGGPGGVAFGLKLAFGDAVHCLFAEPTHSPCMLLGVHTGLHDGVSVQEIGIDNITAADGLAVGRASGFVGRAMERLIDGYHTIDDSEMYNLLGLLNQTESIKLEPSALAGMTGCVHVTQNKGYLQSKSLTPTKLANATHLVWATGGGMVPVDEMQKYLSQANLS